MTQNDERDSPVETPVPVPVESRHGRGRDGGFTENDGLEPADQHAGCLHPELIDDVRQSRKRRWPIAAVFLTLGVGSITTLATCLYQQGQATGSTQVRVEQVETRAREDRVTTDRLIERQRAQDTTAAQQNTDLIESLHAIDTRLGRMEERMNIRPAYQAPAKVASATGD